MWYLDTRPDGVYLMFSEGFQTAHGPNLHMYITKRAAADVEGERGSADVHIAELKSYKGRQLYKLPEGIKLTNYKSLAIVCDTYHKVWAAGDIWHATAP